MNCPCQSGKDYDNCCGRFISHQLVAENAQQLMRSRYTAYALKKSQYLLESWHQDYRPEILTFDDDIQWLRLDIIDCVTQGEQAEVEFEALLLLGQKVEAMRERSRFIKLQGHWLYTSGEMQQPSIESFKPGRNADCPCGSGIKFKRCCGK